MGWNRVGNLHPLWTVTRLGRFCFFLASFDPWLHELVLCISRVASPRVNTGQEGSLPWFLRCTMSLRRQDTVWASELCRRMLTTSVLVRSLQHSQRPQAHHSDTVPATNWAWIMGHTDICYFSPPAGSEVGCKVGGSAKLPLLLWWGLGENGDEGERMCPQPRQAWGAGHPRPGQALGGGHLQ